MTHYIGNSDINVTSITATEYTPTNREKSKTANRGFFWCGGCDRQIVSETGKCPVCGNRKYPKKIR
jgi:hypothetical protein